MKKNKELIVALAAAGAVAGFAAFLFGTKKGKKITKDLKKKGEEFTDEVKEFIGDVTQDVKEFIEDSGKKYDHFKKNISQKFTCQ